MEDISPLEPFDLRLAAAGAEPSAVLTHRRDLRCGALPELDDTTKALLCVAAASEALRRLKTVPRAVNWNAGAEVRGWADPSDALSSLSGEDAVAHLQETLGEPAADGFLVCSDDAEMPAEAFGVRYGFSGADARFRLVAPSGWGRTISPEAELDALAEMLASIFAEIVQSPGSLLGEASGISAQARQFALGPLAGRSADFGAFKPLPLMLKECTETYSERVAYRYRDEELTFAEFEASANGLAQSLQDLGVRKGDVVPVMFASGLEMPLAYYAIMKCGAALVPVDFEWPEDRLAGALGQFSCGLILTSDSVALPMRFRAKQKIVRLAEIVRCAGSVSVPVEPLDAIYGFFTSGTTGVPKCALNNHGALCNRFRAMNRFLGEIGGPVLQNTRYMYDSSIGHMFFALTQGFPVVLPEDGKALELNYVVEMIAAHGIVMTDFVPSVLNQLIAMVERNPEAQSKLQSLRELIVGGEQITPKMVQKLRAFLSPDLRISNCYGITETAIGLTYHPVTDADGMHIPLGRPLDNCFLLIVDDAMRPLPRGGIGQIMVGGICVGNGYMNSPERTGKVFLPNPFPEIPNDRLYATGDNGYFDAQGELEFAGRRDFVTKVGGVLIEPAEIEAAAEALEGVHQSRAFVFDDGGNGAIALIAAGRRELSQGLLRSHLRSKLPKGLMPRHIVILGEMPLADSGKLDQKRLQSLVEAYLEAQKAQPEADPDAPRDDALTPQICKVFSDALSGVTMLPDTNFFDAGGDSLLAVRVALQLEEQFSVAFGVSEIIAHPEPSGAARRIAALVAKGAKRRPFGDELEEDIRTISASLPRTYGTAPAAKPRHVLLTGATGFVGGYLARELLRDPDIRTTALCRGGEAMLLESLKSKGLWETGFEHRLEGLAGDLSQPLLGFGGEQYRTLADECDAILHCGALVNFAFDYQAHRAANVSGTATLLVLAGQGRPKAFHYISTMGVCGKLGGDAPLAAGTPEADELPLPGGGYSQSKLAAERLVACAGRRGLAVHTYRLGEIMPDVRAGTCNEAALTHMLLSSFAMLNCIPDVRARTDWTPADHLARRVVSAVRRGIAGGRTSHEFYPASVDLTDVYGMAGRDLPVIDPVDWLAKLGAQIERAPKRSMIALRNMFGANPTRAQIEARFEDLFTDSPRYFSAAAPGEDGEPDPTRDLGPSIRNYIERLTTQATRSRTDAPLQLQRHSTGSRADGESFGGRPRLSPSHVPRSGGL